MLENTKPGNRSTEFWLSAGIIIVVMIIATILLLIGIINQDNWTKIILYVCGIVSAAYIAGRSVVKTFTKNTSQGEP
jgi:uncharacterized protein (UPF0333 family)